MSPSKLVSKLEHGIEESQNQCDARVEHLWAKLDPTKTGELDFKGLQKGFKKIDHPMKNADGMLRKIMNEVDTSGDGKIQYEEFRIFVERADRQLFQLFGRIDRDGNGKVDLKELQTAFRSAGLTVSNRRLGEFFNDMDHNNDGFITFEEWRDFLLFMPAREYDSQLRAMLSFYDSVAHVTSEGDSIVSEDSLGGLGTAGHYSRSILHYLFGSILRVAFPSGYITTSQPDLPPIPPRGVARGPGDSELLGSSGSAPIMPVVASPPHASLDAAATQQQVFAVAEPISDVTIDYTEHSSTVGDVKISKKFKLTYFIPDPGYFVAGAIAGGVSRTATAPLDRLKVYLLVNTTANTTNTAAVAIKQGKPVSALKNATRPISDAVRDLFRSGGTRGFFAGNGLNVAKIMPETAIKFGSYEAAKRAFANFEGHGDPNKISSYSKFTAGGVAGMVAQFCVYPLDTLKFRLQCETVKGGLTGGALVRQTAMKMYADGGFRSAYRGVTMGLIGMFPYSAIDMGMFELLKKSYRTAYAKYANCHEDDANPGNIVTGFIGATSGAIGATLVYPLNVVRTRLQTQGTVMHRATYTGIWDVTQKTIQREGYRGLYKGLTPNLLKVAPALSITWVVYENSKRVLGLN